MTKTDTSPRDWGELKAFCQSGNMCPIQRASTITDEVVLELIAEVQTLRGNQSHLEELETALRAEITALKSQRDEMAEALERFADVAEHDIGEDESDDDLFKPMPPEHAKAFPLTVGMFRTARDALRRVRSSLNKTEKTDG